MEKKNDDTLFGIDKIRPHVGNVSEATILKYKREYPSFPMRKLRGIWVANKEAIVDWFRSFCMGEIEEEDGQNAPKKQKQAKKSPGLTKPNRKAKAAKKALESC